MLKIIVNVGETLGPWGLAVLMFANAVIGVPSSELVCLWFGAVAAQGRYELATIIGTAVAANTVGTTLLFIGARRVGRQRVSVFLEKVSASRLGWLAWLCGWSQRTIERIDIMFDIYGKWIVCIGRNVPVIRSVISIPAGLSSLRFGEFVVITTLGITLWVSAWCIIGYQLGAMPTHIGMWCVSVLLFVGGMYGGVVLMRRAEQRTAKRRDDSSKESKDI